MQLQVGAQGQQLADEKVTPVQQLSSRSSLKLSLSRHHLPDDMTRVIMLVIAFLATPALAFVSTPLLHAPFRRDSVPSGGADEAPFTDAIYADFVAVTKAIAARAKPDSPGMTIESYANLKAAVERIVNDAYEPHGGRPGGPFTA